MDHLHIFLVHYKDFSGNLLFLPGKYSPIHSNTLKLWRDEFFNKWETISKQGFDLTFQRMWHFYLSYCEAGFKSKNIDLIQFSLQNR